MPSLCNCMSVDYSAMHCQAAKARNTLPRTLCLSKFNTAGGMVATFIFRIFAYTFYSHYFHPKKGACMSNARLPTSSGRENNGPPRLTACFIVNLRCRSRFNLSPGPHPNSRHRSHSSAWMRSTSSPMPHKSHFRMNDQRQLSILPRIKRRHYTTTRSLIAYTNNSATLANRWRSLELLQSGVVIHLRRGALRRLFQH